jgi:hypothetical protein
MHQAVTRLEWAVRGAQLQREEVAAHQLFLDRPAFYLLAEMGLPVPRMLPAAAEVAAAAALLLLPTRSLHPYPIRRVLNQETD